MGIADKGSDLQADPTMSCTELALMLWKTSLCDAVSKYQCNVKMILQDYCTLLQRQLALDMYGWCKRIATARNTVITGTSGAGV